MTVEMFRAYCESHQRKNQISNDEEREHSRYCLQVCKNPSVIGLRNIRCHYLEVELIQQGRIIGCPDIVFLDNTDQVSIVECKNTLRNGRGASGQLIRAHRYIIDSFNISPLLFEVKPRPGNNFHKRQITPDVELLLSRITLNRR